MNGGFVKLYRKLQGHWVTTRLDWYAAWIDILLHTDWKTGRVNLTLVPARKHFQSRKRWQRFIQLLEEDGMLTGLDTVQLGQGRGAEQTASIANWDTYHGDSNVTSLNDSGPNIRHSKGPSNVTAKDTATSQQTSDSNDPNPQSGNSKRHSKRTASDTAKVPQSKKVQEDQERSLQTSPLPNPLPPLREAEEGIRLAPTPGKAIHTLKATDTPAFQELERTAKAAGWKFAQKDQAATIVLTDRDAGLEALRATFDRLERLQYPFKFFTIAAERGRKPTERPSSDAGREEFDRMYEAAMKGDVDELDRLARN